MKEPPRVQGEEGDGAAAASAVSLSSYHVEARQQAGDDGAVLGLSHPFALLHTWRDRRLDEGGAATARRRGRRHRR